MAVRASPRPQAPRGAPKGRHVAVRASPRTQAPRGACGACGPSGSESVLPGFSTLRLSFRAGDPAFGPFLPGAGARDLHSPTRRSGRDGGLDGDPEGRRGRLRADGTAASRRSPRRRGTPTVVREVDDALLAKGRRGIESFLGKAVEKGKATRGAGRRDARPDLLDDEDSTTSKDCDLVVEAIVENMEAKQRALPRARRGSVTPRTSSRATRPRSRSATWPRARSARRTSSGCTSSTPCPLMRLVEVVRHDPDLRRGLCRRASSSARRPARRSSTAKDTPGFVVNLLLVPYLLDAIRALEKGVASREGHRQRR